MMSESKENIELSIVIVNYKTPLLLLNCIESIHTETFETLYEIIVVDNFSEDNSKEIILARFPNVQWIEMTYNSGFSRGNNAGIKASSGTNILLLNSDTIILDKAIDKSFQFFRNFEKKEKAGILGCRMVDSNNAVLFNSNIRFLQIRKLLKTNPFYLKFGGENILNEQNEDRHSRNHETLWLGAAFAIFHSDICKRENIWFDEDFFLYSEDVEWCYRIHKNGYKNYFFADAVIIHIDSGSSKITNTRLSQIVISEWLYIMKTRGKWYYILFLILLRINLALDNLLFYKNLLLKNLTQNDKEEFKRRKFLLTLLRKYRNKILFSYHRKTSSAKEFLKYGTE